MYRKIFQVTFIVSIVLMASNAFGYPWPVPVTTSQHIVSGTLGEYRPGPPVHFHKGVDIAEPAGTPVYAVVSGTIPYGGINNVINGHVQVDRFIYRHIDPNDNLREGQQIIAGVNILGTIAPISHPHLHLEESDGGANSLRPDGLIPYNDNASPECIQNSVHIWRETGINTPDDQNPQITNGILSGVIDISARMKDFYTAANGLSGGGRTGIYEDGGTDTGEIFAPEFSLSYNFIMNKMGV